MKIKVLKKHMAAKHATLYDQEIIIQISILLLNMQIVKWGKVRYGPEHLLPLWADQVNWLCSLMRLYCSYLRYGEEAD